jgi:hypothetical protein
MADARGFTHLLCGQSRVRPVGIGDDEAIARLAGEQHGVIARWQLLEFDICGRSIDYRLATGRLRRLYWGAHAVYAVGHDSLTLTARATAATLATGPGSAASYWTSLALRGLLERPRPLIHVTNPLERRAVKGLFIHRAVLPADEISLVHGVPATSLPRTCLDLSSACEERTLRTSPGSRPATR